MTPKKLRVYKENGRQQRGDLTLSKDIATALVQRIFDGKSLHPTEGYLDLPQESGEPKRILCHTLNTWITRDNVIPETGKTLRSLLNEARVEYRIKLREKRQDTMLDEAEQKLHRAIRIKTKVPAVGMFGVIKDKETGKTIMKENPHLLSIQIDAAKFLTERLDPARYGKTEKTENKHVIFSLEDLRRAKEEAEAKGEYPFKKE